MSDFPKILDMRDAFNVSEMAMRNDDIPLLQHALEQPHKFDPSSLLFHANSKEGVEMVISHGGDAGVLDMNRRTPLHYAANAEVATALLQIGVDLNARSDDGYLPLHQALDGPVAKVLIDNGADVDARDKLGQTPLMSAYKSEIVKELIDGGADVNAEAYDQGKQTPLDCALTRSDPQSALLLIEAGADYTKGSTSYHLRGNPNKDSIQAAIDAQELNKMTVTAGSWSPSQADAEALSPAVSGVGQDEAVQHKHSRRL